MSFVPKTVAEVMGIDFRDPRLFDAEIGQNLVKLLSRSLECGG